MVRPTNQTIQRLFVMLTDPKRVTLRHGGHTGEQPGLSEAEGAGGMWARAFVVVFLESKGSQASLRLTSWNNFSGF